MILDIMIPDRDMPRMRKRWVRHDRSLVSGTISFVQRHLSFALGTPVTLLVLTLIFNSELRLIYHHANLDLTPSAPAQAPLSTNLLLRQAFDFLKNNQPDTALSRVNLVIQASPQNPTAYGLRGAVYQQEMLWDLATRDYQKELQLQPKNVSAQFNLAELLFLQKKYEKARLGFAALRYDVNDGELANYMTFLCDLFGGHEKQSWQELASFKRAPPKASYYFANAAWCLAHHQPDDARRWISSADSIYPPNKLDLYAASLRVVCYPEPSAS